MKVWTRSPIAETCGQCRAVIASGDPLLRFRLEGLKRTFARCPTCADEAMPDDVPALPARVAPEPDLVPVRRLAGLPLDWRTRSLGEREPGEEG